MKSVRVALFALLLSTFATAARLDVPLTVEERGGVDRQQWPVATGIPLPKGAIKNIETLQIVDQQGRFVPAHFSVTSRWPNDASIHWVLCQFAVTVKARARASFWLRELVVLPDFPSPIGFIPRGKDFEVITGPLRFIIGGSSNQLLDQVWVDENWGYDFTEKTKILESGNFEMLLVSAGKIYRSSEIPPRIEVEEYSPLRAIVRVTGSFKDPEKNAPFIDYVSRMTVYGGKTYFKMEFTLLNRTPVDIPIEKLRLSSKMNLDVTQQTFSFGKDQHAYSSNFENRAEASLLQLSPVDFQLSGGDKDDPALKHSLPQGADWVDLFDGELGLSVAVKRDRPFRSRGFVVRNDGTLSAELLPGTTGSPILEKQSAQTRELLFHFHGKRHFADGQVKNVLAGFEKPLIATAPASWYCQNALLAETLISGSSAGGQGESVANSSKLDSWMVRDRDLLREQRPSGRLTANEITTGDMPHALYLHFFRNLDLDSFEFAEELLGGVSDQKLGGVDEPTRVGVDGISGLVDSYLLTGNRRWLESARIGLSPFVDALPPGAFETTGEVAAVLNSLLSSLEIGEERARVHAKQLVALLQAWQDGDAVKLAVSPRLAQTWNSTQLNSLGTTIQENALAWSALRRYGELMNDESIAERLQRSWQWITHQSGWWNSEPSKLRDETPLELVFAAGLAFASQGGRAEDYRSVALKMFQSALDRRDAVSKSTAYGLSFTEGQHLLRYLDTNRPPPDKKDVSLDQSKSGES